MARPIPSLLLLALPVGLITSGCAPEACDGCRGDLVLYFRGAVPDGIWHLTLGDEAETGTCTLELPGEVLDCSMETLDLFVTGEGLEAHWSLPPYRAPANVDVVLQQDGTGVVQTRVAPTWSAPPTDCEGETCYEAAIAFTL